MAKKWKFILTFFEVTRVKAEKINFEGEVVEGWDDIYKNLVTCEIKGLSPFVYQSSQDASNSSFGDWNSVDNPMLLHSYLEKIGDRNSLSFHVKWGLSSTFLLRAFKDEVKFSAIQLSVLKFLSSNKDKKQSKGKADTTASLMTIKIRDGEIINAGHLVKTGFDWFALKFQSSYPVYQ